MKRITMLSTMACLVSVSTFAAVASSLPTSRDDDRKTLTVNVYALDTCPVAGAKLGSMGEPPARVYEHNGTKREVRFCCPPCIETLEADKEKYFAEIDKKLIEQQKPHYPLKECLISGRSLEESDTVVDHIHEGRLVRFCCPGCPARFTADPDRFMKRLDEAIIRQQRERYPLDTCVVAGAKLGSMGEPYEIIVGGSLVRFCCKGCLGGFKDNPVTHLTTIRDAWRKQHEASNGAH